MEITAHMAGTILRVEVDAGARIAAGDEVVVIESMKMEMAISPTADGVVREVRVQPGDVVQEGDVLLVVDA